MKISSEAEEWRVVRMATRAGVQLESNPGEPYGLFLLPGPHGRELRVIACAAGVEEGLQWDHVSVSLTNRPPNWYEMCWVKDLFFEPEDTVIQIHPPKSQYVNTHEHCLHLWRPVGIELPLPPKDLV